MESSFSCSWGESLCFSAYSLNSLLINGGTVICFHLATLIPFDNYDEGGLSIEGDSCRLLTSFPPSSFITPISFEYPFLLDKADSGLKATLVAFSPEWGWLNDIFFPVYLPRIRLRGVHPVLTCHELYDLVVGVPHAQVMADLQVLQGVYEPPLHVSGFSGAKGLVHEALPSVHYVPEQLERREAVLESPGDEAGGHGGEVSRPYVRKRPVSVSLLSPLPEYGLLPHHRSHLRGVYHGALGAGFRHHEYVALLYVL